MAGCCENVVSYSRIIGRKNELFDCHNLDIIHSYGWKLYHSLGGIIEKSDLQLGGHALVKPRSKVLTEKRFVFLVAFFAFRFHQ